MENKYYTPSIEEFRVGFECEFFNNMTNKIWNKEVCDVDLIQIAYDTYEHGCEEDNDTIDKVFRVKYLDKEDIESLGFTLIEDDGDWYFELKESDYNYFELMYNSDRNHLYISDHYQNKLIGKILPREEWDENPLFNGTIKNLSELKILLKQIGVE